MSEPAIPKHISYGVIPIYVNEAGGKEYLLLQNHGGYWSFPKGHKEPDETPKMAALREVQEETALQINEESLSTSIYYDYEQNIGDTVQTKRIVLFPAQIHSKKIAIQHKEIQAFKWATLEEALALINLPSVIEPLQSVENEPLAQNSR